MATKHTPRSTLTHIGGWKLGQTLGRGAYAHVRLATHPNGHQAACKILPALHNNSGIPVSRDQTIDAVEAHKEVVLLKALCGAGLEGVVGLEGVMEEGGWTYVFLTLYPRSASSIASPMSHDKIVLFFRRLLHTVHNLHRLGVSHEDIKRSNVLVDAHGYPALVDFGFSHFKPHGGLVKSAGGTLDYSSPEKTVDKKYDPKANDVWSLGILLTKLIGVPHPYAHSYKDDTSTAVKRRILAGDALFHWKPHQLVAGGVAELVMGMLDRDPEKRWTIPRVLKHPFLKPKYADPLPFHLPPLDYPLLHKVPDSIVEDLCFIAYLNGEFTLCETSFRIEDRLQGKEPCWEKRWAGMLGAWSKRAEMDWEDIPMAITPIIKTKSSAVPPRTHIKVHEKVKHRALKEIHMSPNTPLPVSMVPTGDSKSQKESVPPKPTRSRIYGMKSKDHSQRASAVIVDRQLTLPLGPNDKQRDLDLSSDLLAGVAAAEVRVGGIKRVKKVTGKRVSDFKIYSSDSEESTEVAGPSTKTQMAKPYQLESAGSARGQKASQEKQKSREVKRTGATITATRTKSKTNASPPDRQMKGLLLSLPDVPEPRRRSPRLRADSKEGVTV
ncbi:hypothetical protein IAT38_000809 [Cryptococcus sp. DSM 104549]